MRSEASGLEQQLAAADAMGFAKLNPSTFLSDADIERRREGLRPMAKVEFRHVAKRFGEVEVIPDLDLTIEDGEFVALLGPSGCGKSTSLFILAGIYQPSGGELLFDGRVVNEVEAKDRNVGIVFQSYALYPHMTVRYNVLFPLRFKRCRARRRAPASPQRPISSRSQSFSTGGLASCLVASSSGWRSPAHWCYSSTSRFPISMRHCD
jgi:ABC-type glutathione transport system ATPase component